VHQEIGGRLAVRLGCVRCHRLAVERRRVDVKTRARLQHVRRDQAKQQRKRRHDFEIQQRFAAHPPDLLHVFHAGNAGHHRTEDDWTDDHLDQLDETVPERLHLGGECGIKMPERDTNGNRHEHLRVQDFIERFLHDSSRQRFNKSQ
jgi:hypothetical protein